MGKHRDKADHLDERSAYAMCRRKKNFKGSRAGKLAHKLNQRKYHCPICGHWHLTKANPKGDK